MLDLLKTPLFILKTRQRRAFRHIASRLSGAIIDLGCGGMPYRGLAKCDHYFGLDADPAPEAPVHVRAMAEHLPIRSGAADAIVCTEVLEHASDCGQVMREVSRVLKDGGKLYVSAPMSWCLHYEPNDLRRFTIYGLQGVANDHGFDVLWTQRLGGVFSLVGVRLADVMATKISNMLSPLSVSWAERIAALLVAPWSLFWHVAGLALDRVDHRDAIGWAMLAEKRPAPRALEAAPSP